MSFFKFIFVFMLQYLCGCFVGASYEDVSAGAGTLPIHYTGGAAGLASGKSIEKSVRKVIEKFNN